MSWGDKDAGAARVQFDHGVEGVIARRVLVQREARVRLENVPPRSVKRVQHEKFQRSIVLNCGESVQVKVKKKESIIAICVEN